MVKCKFISDDIKCKTTAIFGIERHRPLSCKKHKLENYKDVCNQMCEKCHVKQSSYGLVKKIARWCKLCKEPDAFDVKHKMCETDDCLTRPTFGIKTAIRCSLHRQKDDTPFWYKYCEVKNCKLIPSFSENIDGMAKRCSKHKLENWVDTSHKSALCKFENCNTQSTFGEENSIRTYCAKHKLHNHIDLTHLKCIFKDCNTQSTFGERNGKRLYCTLHKNIEHISLKHMIHGDLYSSLFNTFCSVKGKDKKHNRNFDLCMDFLYLLYDKQNRKCYYCDNTLNIENRNTKNFDQISIDRKNSKIGHVKGNCVLSCLFCNMSKSDRPIEEYKMFLKFIKNPTQKHEKEDENHTWIPSVLSRIKTKNKETDITKKWIEVQYNKQNEKCFYTGIKMIKTTENRYLFKPSMERIDCSKPYTQTNCVLVCIGANLGRNDLPMNDYLDYIKKISNI